MAGKLFHCVIYFYIFLSLTNNYKALKINYLKKTTTRRLQPIFGYIKHVVDLRIHDKEYSRNDSIYIPASGVIIAPRFVLTAAHLIKRGTVFKIAISHQKCGDRILAYASYAETHTQYKGEPPYYDIALLLAQHSEKHGLDTICEELKPAILPKTLLAYNFGGRAILIGHEHYYEHFYFTTRKITTQKTEPTKSTLKDFRYYSSEYYSEESDEPCCSTPRTMRLLRRRAVENVIRIQHCPVDLDIEGYFFCNHEQNKTIPNEGDIGTGVIDRFRRVIGILSYQRFATFGSNVNFYVDVAAFMSWIKPTIKGILEKELEEDGGTRSKNPTGLIII